MLDVNFTMSVSEAIALINQTFEYAYPTITVVGELSSYKISRGQWLYADLKDDEAKMRLFGTVYQLPGPLEDGMVVEICGEPRLHPQFGFSLQIRTIRVVGEGSIKKAQSMLEAQLQTEGLFSTDRKRQIPYPPAKVGLITSTQSAAYADFIKIAGARWQAVEIVTVDVQVQGVNAVSDITAAIQKLNEDSDPVDVLVIIRGGGSIEDLAAFSTEQLTRAVVASRIPTVAAIGHEIDVSLVEKAADLHASTPSNAAELIFPDQKEYLKGLSGYIYQIEIVINSRIAEAEANLRELVNDLDNSWERFFIAKQDNLRLASTIIESAHPQNILNRGYAIVRNSEGIVSSVNKLSPGSNITITLRDGLVTAKIKESKIL